jgi:hypothetical protein
LISPFGLRLLWAQDFNLGAFVPMCEVRLLHVRLNPKQTWWLQEWQHSPKSRRLTVQNSDADQVKARAEASFRKQERAREGAEAWTEHVAAARATLEKTARLRALRLTKEAAEKTATGAKKAAKAS